MFRVKDTTVYNKYRKIKTFDTVEDAENFKNAVSIMSNMKQENDEFTESINNRNMTINKLIQWYDNNDIKSLYDNGVFDYFDTLSDFEQFVQENGNAEITLKIDFLNSTKIYGVYKIDVLINDNIVFSFESLEKPPKQYISETKHTQHKFYTTINEFKKYINE